MIYDFHDHAKVIETILALLVCEQKPNPWAEFTGTREDIRFVIECIYGKEIADGVRFTVH